LPRLRAWHMSAANYTRQQSCSLLLCPLLLQRRSPDATKVLSLMCCFITPPGGVGRTLHGSRPRKIVQRLTRLLLWCSRWTDIMRHTRRGSSCTTPARTGASTMLLLPTTTAAAAVIRGRRLLAVEFPPVKKKKWRRPQQTGTIIMCCSSSSSSRNRPRHGHHHHYW